MNAAISRRDLLRGSAAALMAWPRGAPYPRPDAADAGTAELRVDDVYRSMGVRPLINARGTFTILSGSLMLPEVREAMTAAAQQYVHLDELTDAIGARLADLTGAEWGIVTSGCAAALTHATAACVAGGNPDLHIRIPHLDGFRRDEVIIPRHSRNVYDAAVRAVGVRVLEVSTVGEYERALGPRTAMVYVLAGPAADSSELPLETLARPAHALDVPVLVDAAAEILTIPNVHLQRGAALVAYSGGKCLRGPQSAGLLLGRKSLTRAAWVHSAPHHGFARGMKVGKEDAIGMLMAVEQWVRRDHDAEWRQWTAWLDEIADRLVGIDTLDQEITEPEGLSNRTPYLRIRWDGDRLGVSGEEVSRILFDSEPRIALSPLRQGGDGRRHTGVSINPYMLSAGEARIIGECLRAVLSAPPAVPASNLQAPAADLTGEWDVAITYLAGHSTHVLHIRQDGNDLAGSHQGDFVTRALSGQLDGTTVTLHSFYGEEHGDALSFHFSGTASGDEMSGALDMGEYRGATWSATRRGAREG
jgi:L-seryl-tRNA(Ser) seleniumtransferase